MLSGKSVCWEASLKCTQYGEQVRDVCAAAGLRPRWDQRRGGTAPMTGVLQQRDRSS